MSNRTLNALTLTAQGAATVNGSDLENIGSRGCHAVIDITAISGTNPTATFTLQGLDSVSGKYYTLLASTALAATGTTVLRVFPGATASANAAANDILPEHFRVICVVGGTGPSVTATVGVAMVG